MGGAAPRRDRRSTPTTPARSRARSSAARRAADAAALRAALAAHGVAITGSLGFEDTLRDRGPARAGGARSGSPGSPTSRGTRSCASASRTSSWTAPTAGPRSARATGSRREPCAGSSTTSPTARSRRGEIDATDVYTTDPEILRQDLVLLEDDLRAFPRVRGGARLPRATSRAARPPRSTAMRRLEGRISAERMIAMNARAQLERAPARGGRRRVPARTRSGSRRAVSVEGGPARVLRRTREHLALVAARAARRRSPCAVPLGVLAARRPAAGRVILGAVGVVQTVPSLALLVFMIPLLGIGAAPGDRGAVPVRAPPHRPEHARRAHRDRAGAARVGARRSGSRRARGSGWSSCRSPRRRSSRA